MVWFILGKLYSYSAFFVRLACFSWSFSYFLEDKNVGDSFSFFEEGQIPVYGGCNLTVTRYNTLVLWIYIVIVSPLCILLKILFFISVQSILKWIVISCEMLFLMVLLVIRMFLRMINMRTFLKMYWASDNLIFFFASWAYVIYILQLEGVLGLNIILYIYIPGANVENNKYCVSIHFRYVEEKVQIKSHFSFFFFAVEFFSNILMLMISLIS